MSSKSESSDSSKSKSSKWWWDWRVLMVVVLAALGGWYYFAREKYPEPKAVPGMQVAPLPYDQASFQRNGVEIARYHFGGDLDRPFVYPIIGPSGRSLTRMGHPWDPTGHSHHNSVWISHNDVDGVSFWADGGGRIVHKRVVGFEDGGSASKIICENEWVGEDGKVLMLEKRQVTALLLENDEWLLVIDMELTANGKAVTLGKTPFGMIGVRVAKTIGVHDGNGRIRSSEGAVNEEQILWKQARWVDYSGAVAAEVIEGVTLFDHPDNPNHPSYFHVREDGWMGASLTYDKPRVLEVGKPLKLRYGLYVHADMKPAKEIEAQWKRFRKLDIEVLQQRDPK